MLQCTIDSAYGLPFPETMQRLLDQVTPERIRAAAQSVTLDTVYFLHGKEEA